MVDGAGNADPQNGGQGLDPNDPNSGSGAGNQDGDQDADLDLAKLKVEDLDTLDATKVKELAAKLIPQNKRLFERAKKPKEAASSQPPKLDGEEPSIPNWGKELQLLERKRQFAYENGLSPDEADAVFRFNSKPTKETLNDPFIKGGLDAIKARKRIDNATPSPSGGSPKVNGKTFGELSRDEREKNFETYRRQKIGK